MEFCEPPVTRKLAVGHLCVRQLVFWLLVVSSYNYFKMHAWSTSMILLLHSAFMLSVVKILLKGQFGGCALNSHGKYIEYLLEPYLQHRLFILKLSAV